jgi:hypothetical protein
MAEHQSPADVEEMIEDVDESLETLPFTYSITAYGADYPVDSLVKRIEAGDIAVPRFSWEPGPDSDIVGFQREYVWPKTKADRFVESLLLGLPVPGIFLVKEVSGRLLVLDGHQRLYTLQSFFRGILLGEEFALGNVQAQFRGKTYRTLDLEDRRRLDDSIIHATVVRQDEPTQDQSSIYMIFERLNTGGVNLQPQEIRVALYHGDFVAVLRRLNELPSWRQLYGKKSRRLKDMEMILRFFAFYLPVKQYRSPMKEYLNAHMAANQSLQRQSEAELTRVFTSTTDTILGALGPGAFRPRRAINAAVIDSLMTGIAKRLAKGPIASLSDARESYDKLLANPKYKAAIETGTSQEANVASRLALAEEAFADLP